MKCCLIVLILLLFFQVTVSQWTTYRSQIQKQSIRRLGSIDELQGVDIEFIWVENNLFYQSQVVTGNYHVLVTKYDSNQCLNLNLYSYDSPFTYLYQIDNSKIQQNQQNQQNLNQYFQQTSQEVVNQVKSNPKIAQKLTSNLQYKHFLSLQPSKSDLQLSQSQNTTKFLFIIVFFPQSNPLIPNYNSTSQKYNLISIFTTNQTLIAKQSFQKKCQYKLQNNTSHIVKISANELLNQKNQNLKDFSKISFKTEDTENLLNFHILHVVGDFQYNVSLIKSGKNQNSFEKNSIATNLTESTYSINRTLINQKYDFSNSLMKNQKNQLTESQIWFEIKCISKTCIFISSVQNSSQIKKVVPGLPYLYSINEIQIFEITNPFDLQIFIDVNKKNGLPQYQICSIKVSDSQENECINQLKNPISKSHILEVKENDDKIHNFGRNHQVLINIEHEEYCYKCSYYVALYAEYDNFLGIITFKNILSTTLASEGNSVTKILKRNQSDAYEIYGFQSNILLENFSGQFQIFFQQIDLEAQHNFSIQTKLLSQKLSLGNQLQNLRQNYYSIDLREKIRQQTSQKADSQNNKIYKINIQTKNNFPSTFYTMIIANNDSKKIVLKDGIPFYSRQTNKISVFKYLTENIETQSFGTIIISSSQIQEIALEIYGDCLTLQNSEKSDKKYKIEKQEDSTLQNLRKRAKISGMTGKKIYSLQKIQNAKINVMANRIDIIIEPKLCKSYIIKVINNSTKQAIISYEVLVSFIDSIILNLNNQLPGILQYPGKIIQIYEIYVPQKTNLSIMINFCRSAKSRMKIYRNREALINQNLDEKVFFNSESEFQEITYLARPGVFYVTIQFFGFSNILEYTIIVKQHETEEGFYYVDLSQQEREISYKVKQGRFFSTTYELYFSPVFLKHWNKDIQRDVEYFETNYFILESNSYPLLKRASNCKGQFFSDIVNHHQHFREVKLEKEKLKFHPPQKTVGNEKNQLSYYERGYYSYEYETQNPLSFLIIVPIIARSTGSDQKAIVRYWQFDKKSRQPYQITQLYNEKLFSVFQHWFISLIIWAQQIVDFHAYQSFLVTIIVVCSCLPLSCCLLICVYKIKVSIQFYCTKLFNYIQTVIQKSNIEIRDEIIEVSAQIQIVTNQRIDNIPLPTQQLGDSISNQNDNTQNQIEEEQFVRLDENDKNIDSQGNFQQELQESPLT